MTDAKQEKIRRFVNDEVMAESVKEMLLATYLKPKPISDVYVLAASRIAINLLEEAWRELEKYKAETVDNSTSMRQVGL